MFRLLVCVENRIYRDGLHLFLGKNDKIRVVKECARLAEAERAMSSASVDVVLVDIAPVDALKTINCLFQRARHIPIIALGLDESEEQVLACAEAGASAYVTKNGSVEDLLNTIEMAAAGELRCSPRIAGLLRARLADLACRGQRDSLLPKLSRRERHVLSRLNQAKSNKQIARELGLEVSTVKNHVHSILVKLGVHRRAEAVAALAQAS